MNKTPRIELNDLDPAELLDDDETIAHYLALSAENADPDVFLSALADVARARGMSHIAKKTGLSRQNLYKAFKPGANPHFLTVRKVMNALGVPFTAQAKNH